MVDRSTGDGSPRPVDDGAGRPETAPADGELARRLEHLDTVLKARLPAADGADGKGRSSGFGRATKVASEFVAGIVVGGGLGWFFDRAFGTLPWGLIVFLLLGFGAGVLNVLRAEGKVADPGAKLREAAGNRASTSDPSER